MKTHREIMSILRIAEMEDFETYLDNKIINLISARKFTSAQIRWLLAYITSEANINETIERLKRHKLIVEEGGYLVVCHS